MASSKLPKQIVSAKSRLNGSRYSSITSFKQLTGISLTVGSALGPFGGATGENIIEDDL